jgi:hypothetical protein
MTLVMRFPCAFMATLLLVPAPGARPMRRPSVQIRRSTGLSIHWVWDEASLTRLEKAASTQQRDDLKQLVAAARSAGPAGKAAAVPVDISSVSPEQYSACTNVNRAALRARLTGNSRYIAPIVTAEGDVVVPSTVPAPVSLPLRQQVAALCGDLPEQPIVNSAALDRLAAVSRWWSDDDDSSDRRHAEEEERRPEEEPAGQPVEVLGGGYDGWCRSRLADRGSGDSRVTRSAMNL